jgi:hypothetical protein
VYAYQTKLEFLSQYVGMKLLNSDNATVADISCSSVFACASNAEQFLRLCVYSKIAEQAENSISAIEKIQGAKSSDSYFFLVRAFAHGRKYIRLYS